LTLITHTIPLITLKREVELAKKSTDRQIGAKGVLPKCNEKEKVVIGYEVIIPDSFSAVFKITL
ncbi:hypothetical protein ACFFH2_02500, partial [Enterococcus devriesei]|uniref:hypothetical protein n=1 Tax=Enterococcus devriesei TaxID=319970 RepID=UPI0035EE20B4